MNTKPIYAVYRECTVKYQMYGKLLAKFCTADCLLKDDPLLCRSVEIDNNKIKAILENNQYRGQFFAEKYKFKEDPKASRK